MTRCKFLTLYTGSSYHYVLAVSYPDSRFRDSREMDNRSVTCWRPAVLSLKHTSVKVSEEHDTTTHKDQETLRQSGYPERLSYLGYTRLTDGEITFHKRAGLRPGRKTPCALSLKAADRDKDSTRTRNTANHHRNSPPTTADHVHVPWSSIKRIQVRGGTPLLALAPYRRCLWEANLAIVGVEDQLQILFVQTSHILLYTTITICYDRQALENIGVRPHSHGGQ